MNVLTIIGRLTADPELRIVNVKGVETPVLNFQLAVDDGQKRDANGKKIGTEFFNLTAWRGAAEAIAQYRRKGSSMSVTGPVHLKSYVKNNEVRYAMAIDRPLLFEFVGPSGETTKRIVNDVPEEEAEVPAAAATEEPKAPKATAPAKTEPEAPATAEEDDDFPF